MKPKPQPHVKLTLNLTPDTSRNLDQCAKDWKVSREEAARALLEAAAAEWVAVKNVRAT